MLKAQVMPIILHCVTIKKMASCQRMQKQSDIKLLTVIRYVLAADATCRYRIITFLKDVCKVDVRNVFASKHS